MMVIAEMMVNIISISSDRPVIQNRELYSIAEFVRNVQKTE